MDKPSDILVSALKEAMARPEPMLLFKAGKQAGLFASRNGSQGEAAQRALADGFLEVTRKEPLGKIDAEWVRITPRGVQFVYQEESPRAVLEELLGVLSLQRDGLPEWLAEIRGQMQAVANRFGELVERQCHYLDQLAKRAEEAMERLSKIAEPERAAVSGWQLDALAYLEQRRAAGAGDCALSELFHALCEKQHSISIGVFHDGVTRLQDQGAVELLPYQADLKDLAEPEYALVEGAVVYASVRRR